MRLGLSLNPICPNASQCETDPGRTTGRRWRASCGFCERSTVEGLAGALSRPSHLLAAVAAVGTPRAVAEDLANVSEATRYSGNIGIVGSVYGWELRYFGNRS